MKERKISLDKIYERDPITRAYLIKVAIDTYNDIFNDFDPAPFKKRDLDPDLRQYLEDCSLDIPLKYPVILQFNIPKEKRDDKKEERIKTGLKTYFSFFLYSLRRNYNRSYKRNLYNFITAFIFLIVAFFLNSLEIEFLLFLTLTEGLFIGGWVFLWRAISSIAFEHRDLKQEYRMYKRLNDAIIRFNYIRE